MKSQKEIPARRNWRALVAIWIAAVALTGGLRAQEVDSCTEDDARFALENGGDVSFSGDCDITLSQGPIVISSDTFVDTDGGEIILRGNGSNNVFVVEPGVFFSLDGITITDGQSTNGGAIYINADAIVELTDCVFSNNVALGTNGLSASTNTAGGSVTGASGGKGTSGSDARGGAIYNLGDLTVTTCQFLTNSAVAGIGGDGGPGGSGSVRGGDGGNGGDGGVAFGGAIYSEGPLSVDSSTFDGNTAVGGDGGFGGVGGDGQFIGRDGSGGIGGDAAGAGIYSLQTDGEILASTFSNNEVSGGSAGNGRSGTVGAPGKKGGSAFGGGLFNMGDFYIENSTFFRNSAAGGNGGNGGSGSFSGGKAGPGGKASGGGLCTDGSGVVTVLNCTFAMGSAVGGTNGAAGGGAISGKTGKAVKGQGGNIANLAKKKSGGFLYLENSIIGTNTAGGSGYGTITDQGHNIVADKSVKVGSGSFKKTDPKLGPLADNGGPTLTMAIGTNSPAFDAGNDADAPFVDQRGVDRPQQEHSDIGAFELALNPPDILGITTQPASISTNPPQTVTQTNGGTVTLTVNVLGDTPISYRWWFNDTNRTRLVKNTLNSSLSVNSLVLSNLSTNQLGTYFVTVSNAYGGATSGLVLVTNAAPPVITNQPASQVVTNGGSATFSVGVTGEPPLVYQWRFSGTNLVGQTNADLSILNAQTNNIGDYTVLVTNQFGSVLSSAASLNMSPFIITQPADQSAAAGSSVTFTVVAGGSTPLHYTWHFGGSQVGGDAPSYNKSSVQTNDAGGYFVTVANSYGSVDSRVATLTVTPAGFANLPASGLQAESPAPNLPLTMSLSGLVEDHFSFAFPSSTGLTYEVQYKESLNDANWIPLATNHGTGAWITNSFPMTSNPNRFFRVLAR